MQSPKIPKPSLSHAMKWTTLERNHCGLWRQMLPRRSPKSSRKDTEDAAWEADKQSLIKAWLDGARFGWNCG